MSEKQDRQGVRKASELEQKYNFGRSFDNLNGAVVAATRAAINANAAASSASKAAEVAATAVCYTAQSLTDGQKAQARANIGAVTLAEVLEDIPVYDGEVVEIYNGEVEEV